MSDYTQCKTEIKDKEALIAALADLVGDRSKIQVYDEPVELQNGNMGKKGKAHIVVPKKYAGDGYYSRDIGFEKMPDGNYKMWVTDMPGSQDSVENHCRETKRGGTGLLMRNYAKHTVLKKLKQKGRRMVSVKEKDGKIQIRAKVRTTG